MATTRGLGLGEGQCEGKGQERQPAAGRRGHGKPITRPADPCSPVRAFCPLSAQLEAQAGPGLGELEAVRATESKVLCPLLRLRPQGAEVRARPLPWGGELTAPGLHSRRCPSPACGLRPRFAWTQWGRRSSQQFPLRRPGALCTHARLENSSGTCGGEGPLAGLRCVTGLLRFGEGAKGRHGKWKP